MSRFSAYGSLAALIAAAALSSGAAQADPLFAFLTPTARTRRCRNTRQPKRHRTQTRNSIRACNGRTWLTPARKRPVPSSSIRPTPCSLRARRRQSDPLRHRRRPRGLRVVWRQAGRAQGRVAGLVSAAANDRAPAYLPRMTAGGPGNPLGARAMYLGGTEYRIHGTNDPTTIGKHVSSGCIRLTNEDVEDLYNRVQIGAKVVVLPQTAPATIARKLPPRGRHRSTRRRRRGARA